MRHDAIGPTDDDEPADRAVTKSPAQLDSEGTATVQACRACGAAAIQPFYSVAREGRQHVIVRCRVCGFAQVEQSPSAAELASIYGESYFSDRKYSLDAAARREQERRLALMAAAGVQPGSRLLDVGCATGDFLLAAKDRYDVWGLDFSQEAIAIARARLPTLADRLHSGTLTDMPYPAMSFDAVALWDVIEHVWEPRLTLARAAVLLRPGGTLVLSTPNIGATFARLCGRRWPFLTPPEHLGYFTHGSLSRLLDDCGFDERLWTSRGKWVNVGFMFHKLRRIFPAVPENFVRSLRAGPLGRAIVYVPSGDILYLGAQKRA